MKKIREILLFSLCVLLFSGSLTAAAADGAPIAENLEIMTYRGISVGGQLKAFDPEGEEVHFRITTEPRKGTLTLEENGEFVYTPAEGKRGRDYFGYCASDPNGNVSQEATVVITIRKAGKGAGYADTAGLSCEYAACVLAEEGLFTGRCVCGQYLFEPGGDGLLRRVSVALHGNGRHRAGGNDCFRRKQRHRRPRVDTAVCRCRRVRGLPRADVWRSLLRRGRAGNARRRGADTLQSAAHHAALVREQRRERRGARHTGAGGVRSSADRNGCGSVSHARSGGGAFPKGARSSGTARLTKTGSIQLRLGAAGFGCLRVENRLFFRKDRLCRANCLFMTSQMALTRKKLLFDAAQSGEPLDLKSR